MVIYAYFSTLNNFSHSPQSASIDGNTRFAPAWLKTSSFNEPVLASTVNFFNLWLICGKSGSVLFEICGKSVILLFEICGKLKKNYFCI